MFKPLFGTPLNRDHPLAQGLVACMICGKTRRLLNHTHLKSHGLTSAEYAARFPGAIFCSVETREKIRKAEEGKLRGPRPKELRDRLSQIHKGKRLSTATEFKAGMEPWNKGKVGVMATPWNKGKTGVLSDEARAQMSRSHTGVKLPSFSEQRRRNMGAAKKGEKHWLWKGGITPEHKQIRQSLDYRLWREAVFARDDWTCQRCEVKGGRLHPHHVKNFAQHSELRFVPENGITFCTVCHSKFHATFGMKDNSRAQVMEFLS